MDFLSPERMRTARKLNESMRPIIDALMQDEEALGELGDLIVKGIGEPEEFLLLLAEQDPISTIAIACFACYGVMKLCEDAQRAKQAEAN